MSAILNQCITVCDDITLHPSWVGLVSGLKAEKMLRGRNKPYLYLLRAGEFDQEYYATYIDADLTIRHQPFVITIKPEGWYYEQGGPGGPFTDATTIDDVIHAIIHGEEGECSPLINFQR